jgi:hypothetical protein
MPIDHTRRTAPTHDPSPSYDAAVAGFELDMIRGVDHEMRGHDAHEVYAVLVERIHGRLPAVDLDELDLPLIAGAIANGTLTDWLRSAP